MGFIGAAAGARLGALNQQDAQAAQQAAQALELRQKMFADLLQMNAQKSADKRADLAMKQAELRQALEDKRFALSQSQFEEGARHNRAMEANAAQSAGSKNTVPSEGERKNAMLTDIAADAEPRITEAGNSIANSALSKIPVVGNALTRHFSKDYQASKQAASQFAEAYLRMVSGATVTPQEIDKTVATFLPNPGDDPNLLAQKARTRMLMLVSMRKAAGRAPTNPLPEPKQTVGPNKNDVPGNISLGGSEQQQAYDKAAAALKAQGKDPASILGPRP